jgi:hypothetical protein
MQSRRDHRIIAINRPNKSEPANEPATPDASQSLGCALFATKQGLIAKPSIV